MKLPLDGLIQALNPHSTVPERTLHQTSLLPGQQRHQDWRAAAKLSTTSTLCFPSFNLSICLISWLVYLLLYNNIICCYLQTIEENEYVKNKKQKVMSLMENCHRKWIQTGETYLLKSS